MAFEAMEVSLELIRSIRGAVDVIRRRDPELFLQIRRAASSASLNLAEGRRRSGKDRRYHFRVAAGSADEVLAALRVAVAWGYLSESSIRRSLALGGRLQAMLWPLTR